MTKTLFFTCVFFLLLGCKAKIPTHRIYFFENEKRAIIIPVRFNDSICGRFLFDTGVSDDQILVDSTFAANNPLPVWNGEPDQTWFSVHTAWEVEGKNPEYLHKVYYQPTDVAFCGNKFTYNTIIAKNQKLTSCEDLQGTIGFPKNDSTHIWELNFEHNYLEVHDVMDFNKPENCYWLPIINNGESIYPRSAQIQFPITVKSADGDTTTINCPLWIDTGATLDFVIFPSIKEIDFFKNKEADALINNFGGYQSRYDVSATVFGELEIDSMRLYTDEFSTHLTKAKIGIIGLNFLKRFNVFFDFNRQQIGLQPIANFSRIFDPEKRKFYFSTTNTPDGRQFVAAIPERVKHNPYKDAGLRQGDEIIAVNGFRINKMSRENIAQIRTSSTKIIEVVREGKPFELTVYIDQDEANGKGE